MKNSMKRILSVLLVVVILTGLGFVPSATIPTTAAETYVFENFEYSIRDDGTISIEKYSGKEEIVIIPSVIDGKSVRKIATYAFYNNSSITEIVIPEGIIELGSGAFYQLNYLRNIIVPTSVATITNNPFNSCARLENITVTGGNQNYCSVDGVLFDINMETLISYPTGRKDKEYSIPGGVKCVGQFAFHNAKSLEKVVIPDSVTEIQYVAFSNCSNLATIDISKNVKIIGSDAFFRTAYYNNKKNWENNILYLDNYLLNAAENVYDNDTCTVRGGTTVIADHAFASKVCFSEVIFPDSVVELGEGTFYINDHIRRVVIGNGVTTIRKSTFSGCSLLKSVTFSKNVTKIENAAFYDCSVADIYYTGTEEDWNKIEIGSNANDRLKKVTIHYNYSLTTGPIFPDWYDFDRDRYHFENIKETIDIKYYTSMFDDEKGNEIYKYIENGDTHGHCHGMALTTAATLINAPYVTDYLAWSGAFYTKLIKVNEGTFNVDLDMSAKDYIKYAQVYASSYNVQMEANQNINDLQGLIAAVKDYLNGSSPVLITFIDGPIKEGPSDHTVYAIGMDGNDILINDSNEPDQITRIEIDGDMWSYSGDGLTWTSRDSMVTYSFDILTPYIALKNCIKVEGRDIPSNEIEEISGLGDRYAVGMPIVGAGINLVTDAADAFDFAQNDTMILIENSMGSEDSETETKGSLYWLNDGHTINARNTTTENAVVKVTGDELAIAANVPANAQTEITVDAENENQISIQCNENKLSVITFSSVNDDGVFVNTTISGTAADNTITATQTETGLLVTGISDGTVTLSKDDEVIATQTINDAISDIEITYDKTGEDENIEVDYEQPEEPTDPEEPTEPEVPTDPEVPTEPATPDEPDNNCTCMCHNKNSFMQFIYTIIRFLWQLFGMNMDCACGAKHFDAYLFG